MKYDLVGNLTKMTDDRGRVTTNTYDELNRRTSSTIANVTPIDVLDIPITNSRIKYDGVGNVLVQGIERFAGWAGAHEQPYTKR